ncbi:MAG: class I SAM-dependent methyltransferase [Chloroflexota bacterium]
MATREADLKAQVRAFYDSVGWKQVGEGLYQNARYEDLRPVSREYIHRCHLRVARHLPPHGRLLLDAGSGPIQYPEYLEYSRGFKRHVCLDISRRALVEARSRLGEHGSYVVGDIANLPFADGVFEGMVSLHAVHHLPADEHSRAFAEFYRTLRPGGKAVVVYSWGEGAPLTRVLKLPIAGAFAALRLYRRLARREMPAVARPERGGAPQATFTHKYDYRWARQHLSWLPGLEVRVWRSASTSFLRAFIHRPLLGRQWLRLLYWFEERAPRVLGRLGQYPMFLFHKPSQEHPRLEA